MKFQSSLANLREALDLVSKAVAERSTLPVLGMVLLEAEGEWVTVKSTNLELGIVTRFPAEIDEPFSVCVPFKAFNDYVAKLGHGDLTVSLNPKTVTITIEANGFRGNIKSLDAVEFPVLQKPTDATNTFALATGEFVDALTRVVFSAAEDNGRPVLNAILFHIQKKHLTLAAADRFRLSVYNSLKADTKDGNWNVPLASAVKLLGIASKLPCEDTMSVTFNPSNAYFSWDSGLGILSVLTEGNFPDYNQIIPKEDAFLSHITMKRSALDRAIALSSVFARESANTVRFDAIGVEGGYEFRIASMSAETGDSNGLVDAKIDGEPVQWALNAKFVDEFVKVAKSDDVTFHLIGGASPVVLEEVGNDGYTHVMMPMSLGK